MPSDHDTDSDVNADLSLDASHNGNRAAVSGRFALGRDGLTINARCSKVPRPSNPFSPVARMSAKYCIASGSSNMSEADARYNALMSIDAGLAKHLDKGLLADIIEQHRMSAVSNFLCASQHRIEILSLA